MKNKMITMISCVALGLGLSGCALAGCHHKRHKIHKITRHQDRVLARGQSRAWWAFLSGHPGRAQRISNHTMHKYNHLQHRKNHIRHHG